MEPIFNVGLGIWDSLAILFVTLVFIHFILSSKKSGRPPGPLGLPLLGNLHQLGSQPWKTMLTWKKLYGAIMTVRFGTFEAIILTDAKLIREAFALPALAGRPRIKIFNEVAQGRGLGCTDGPMQREQRIFMQKQMRTLVMTGQRVEEAIKQELEVVIKNIEKESKDGAPVQMEGRFNVPTLNGVWNLLMGHRFEHDDPQIHHTIDLIQKSSSFDGILARLTFFIPILTDLFPNATGHAKRMGEMRKLFQFNEQQLSQPLPPSYVEGQPENYRQAYIEQMKRNKDNKNSCFYPPRNDFPVVITDMLAGAMETTGTELSWFIIFIVRHPDIQQKLFEEINSVIGTNEPCLSHRRNTPYVEAVINEVIRLQPAIPLGIFHRAMEDVQIFGRNIKKGTNIISNLYACHHDPEVWDDPEVFKPERFLVTSESRLPSEPQSASTPVGESGLNSDMLKNLIAFSSGKRSCIGESVARDTMYLYVTTLIQKFKISAVPGNIPTLDGVVGFVVHPRPFSVIFNKRQGSKRIS